MYQRDQRPGELGSGWHLGGPRWGPCRDRPCSPSPPRRRPPEISNGQRSSVGPSLMFPAPSDRKYGLGVGDGGNRVVES